MTTEEDIPTDEEIKQYLEGLRTSTGPTFYDDTFTEARVQAMCHEGRRKIFETFLMAWDRSKIGEPKDLDWELIYRGQAIVYSILLDESERQSHSAFQAEHFGYS